MAPNTYAKQNIYEIQIRDQKKKSAEQTDGNTDRAESYALILWLYIYTKRNKPVSKLCIFRASYASNPSPRRI